MWNQSFLMLGWLEREGTLDREEADRADRDATGGGALSEKSGSPITAGETRECTREEGRCWQGDSAEPPWIWVSLTLHFPPTRTFYLSPLSEKSPKRLPNPTEPDVLLTQDPFLCTFVPSPLYLSRRPVGRLW